MHKNRLFQILLPHIFGLSYCLLAHAGPPLHDPKILGTLTGPEGNKLTLVQGTKCSNCTQNAALMLLEPLPNNEYRQIIEYIAPGHIRDVLKKRTYFQARAFYGKCLKKKDVDVLIFFVREELDHHRGLQRSVSVVSPGPEFAREEVITGRRMPKIERAIHSPLCHEIPGIDRTMSSDIPDTEPIPEESDDTPTLKTIEEPPRYFAE